MASESVTATKTATIMVNIGEQAVPFQVSDMGFDPGEYGEIARRLLDVAQAALRNVASVGNNQGDREGTLEDAVMGADILTQLAREFFRVADEFDGVAQPSVE